ncbi:MAG: UDP-N-acetylmuramoyl-L-alanine--D-glutamate ligase [Ruminococcaceae bacterium]|nr:UDP-N-acetylmuramoyl-L-alanine--D-glutamate ligase [Oscillospiraceae bacterium]
MKRSYEGKAVTLLGFGRSGRAVADFLLPRGAALTVFAKTPPDEGEMTHYAANGVRFCIGALPERLPGELLVRSPAIRPDLPPILAAVARGAQLTSEIELLFDHTAADIIAVTGSDGKTTTASLIAALLREAGHTVYLGGNIGTPLLPMATQMRSTDVAVVELSSFQLMTLQKAPRVGVITNMTPNHLNWHRDMAEYIAAKCKIAANGIGFLVHNGACPTTVAAVSRLSCPKVAFTVQQGNMILADGQKTHTVPVPSSFSLPGAHNKENLAAAYAAVRELVTPAQMAAAVADFHGVPHRLQTVDTVRGVRFINSSIDTTPTRTAAALSALDRKPILIAGGRGKGVSFAPFGGILAEKTIAVCLYGEAAEELEQAIGGRVPTHRFDAFAAAFHAAAKMAKCGDTVLLSPACTAFDQFRDFAHRGEAFCRLVREFKEEGLPL